MKALINLILICFSLSATAQCSDMYPVQKSLSSLNLLGCAPCVSGDCNEGQGVRVYVQSLGPSKNDASKYVFAYYRYDGKFSDKGQLFTGKVFSYLSPYHVETKKGAAVYVSDHPVDFTAIPTVFEMVSEGNMTLKNEMYMDYVLGQNTPVNQNGPFYPMGDVSFRKTDRYGNNGVRGIFKGYPIYLGTSGGSGDEVRNLQGLTNKEGYVLVGEADLPGGHYRGTFFNNRPAGYGSISKDGRTRYIFTDRDGMKDALGGMNLPDSAVLKKIARDWAARGNDGESQITISYQRKGENTKTYTMKGRHLDRDGNPASPNMTGPGFFWQSPHAFYVGLFESGKPHGNGYWYLSQKYREGADVGMQDWTFTGKFDHGFQQSGFMQPGYLIQIEYQERDGLTKFYTSTEASAIGVQHLTMEEQDLANARDAFRAGNCRAVEMFEKIAASNSEIALMVSDLYRDGWWNNGNYCLLKDPGKSMQWLRRSVEAKNAVATARMASAYRYGWNETVTVDTAKARAYSLQAIALGNEEERKNLAEWDNLKAEQRASREAELARGREIMQRDAAAAKEREDYLKNTHAVSCPRFGGKGTIGGESTHKYEGFSMNVEWKSFTPVRSCPRCGGTGSVRQKN